MEIKEWLNGIVSNEHPPENIIAYYFGLIESVDHYMIYLVGSIEYDPDDTDWACNEDFVPENKYLRLEQYKGLNWEEVLEYVSGELDTLLKTETISSSFLGKADAIAVGFDDGDLVTLR